MKFFSLLLFFFLSPFENFLLNVTLLLSLCWDSTFYHSCGGFRNYGSNSLLSKTQDCVRKLDLVLCLEEISQRQDLSSSLVL